MYYKPMPGPRPVGCGPWDLGFGKDLAGDFYSFTENSIYYYLIIIEIIHVEKLSTK